MLALKRLADVEADGDHVYAVIRGIGSSSDGRFKSIYAPRREGQVEALWRAYADAGVGPEEVGLLECHGTGTPLGDLTELSALREVFTQVTDRRQTIAIGSVKSQIGHTKAAAGAAGLIKAALALQHKILPPSIGAERPRETADFASTPFYINSETRPWIADPRRPKRRAGVSSFGFGGTNFHLVLEEHDSADVPVLHQATRVHVWWANTPEELIGTVEDCEEPADLTERIPAGAARVAIVAATPHEREQLRAEALRRLRSAPSCPSFDDVSRDIHYRRSAVSSGRVAVLFTGQGSQYVGMGAQAAMAVPTVRAAFDAAATSSSHDVALGNVIFPPPASDDDERAAQEAALRQTDVAQPAIGALAAGQYGYLAMLGLRPDGALGHSFGELVALWAAGSLTDDELHQLAGARGRAMARRPRDLEDPGAMAAIQASEDVVRVAGGRCRRLRLQSQRA
jgi:acyl transferase domain-containing protein